MLRGLPRKRCPTVARAIFDGALERLPARKALWLAAIQFERQRLDSPERMGALLDGAVKHCPRVTVFWLMFAKERWNAGDVAAARDILEKAFKENPGDEEIWLAAFKLEWMNGEVVRARALLERARQSRPSGRVYMKSAMLERDSGALEDAIALLESGVELFPPYAKLWLMLGQIHESRGEIDKARSVYEEGVKRSAGTPLCATLWISLSVLEENVRGIVRARSVLELCTC